MNSLTKTERENLIKVYKKLDENGDGKLARVELINAVRNYLDETNQAETETKRRQVLSIVETVVKAIDKDKNGLICLDEMATTFRDECQDGPVVVVAAILRFSLWFANVDSSNDGKISKEELYDFIYASLPQDCAASQRGSQAENLAEMVTKKILAGVDADSDGMMSVEEAVGAIQVVFPTIALFLILKCFATNQQRRMRLNTPYNLNFARLSIKPNLEPCMACHRVSPIPRRNGRIKPLIPVEKLKFWSISSPSLLSSMETTASRRYENLNFPIRESLMSVDRELTKPLSEI
ncbi:Oidioi.mRNA.OKI2018_I69.chr2.g6315.t1.cds [Oikopleura dioica]|uniref:Oidioi.mRNA.OKI2018_I69.chr2.g6315.t1.cds n=1 Tax=Oikopleura dioica TaxID=34765 RepID=A0ABN7T7E7_OIKDI|nr:Oidioi.mRNA.OKI2018_I69.chr2.g6315.t1.cds [Oikopleura dioica]